MAEAGRKPLISGNWKMHHNHLEAIQVVQKLSYRLQASDYEAVDVSVIVDDTMCKGVESWAWYGVQPVNKLVLPGGVLIVTSDKQPDELLRAIKVKDYDYTLAVVPSPATDGVFAPNASASLAGLWVFKDDNTDFYCLAAVARVAPQIVSLDSVLQIVRERTSDENRVLAVRAMYDQIILRQVK